MKLNRRWLTINTVGGGRLNYISVFDTHVQCQEVPIILSLKILFFVIPKNKQKFIIPSYDNFGSVSSILLTNEINDSYVI